MTKRWAWLLGTAAVLLFVAAMGLLIFWTPPTTIVRGVSIGPIEVGGMRLEEARQRLNERLAGLADEIELITAGGRHQVKRVDLVAGYDLERSLREALAVGRGKGLWHDIQSQRQLQHEAVTIPLYLKFNESGLAAVHQRLSNQYSIPSRIASFVVRGDTVDIAPSQDGQTVERDDLAKAVKQVLERLETTVQVPIKTVKPSPNTEELTAMGIKEKMTEFSSTFSLALAGRVHNIKTAARALDGQIIAPGQVFSFNDVVGPADASDGYQDAIIISNGEFTNGVGGGVCQVSSTLYGAVLRANLKITERHNHSLIVTYVPPALDATVNHPVHDFRFENSSAHHVMIKTETVGERVVVRLYGQRDRTTQVQVESQVLETYPAPVKIIPDDTMTVGQEEVLQNGSTGYLAVSHRKVYKDGVLIRTEKLSQDYYSPSTRVIRTGTKPAPTTTPVVPEQPAVPPNEGTKPTPNTPSLPTPGGTTLPTPGQVAKPPTDGANVPPSGETTAPLPSEVETPQPPARDPS